MRSCCSLYLQFLLLECQINCCYNVTPCSPSLLWATTGIFVYDLFFCQGLCMHTHGFGVAICKQPTLHVVTSYFTHHFTHSKRTNRKACTCSTGILYNDIKLHNTKLHNTINGEYTTLFLPRSEPYKYRVHGKACHKSRTEMKPKSFTHLINVM